jgi:DNA-binding GntR family transcriptional regulator
MSGPTYGTMQRLATVSLREQAAQVLRANVMSGQLVPGEIYSVATLAEGLGVSATPVREALLDLASTGLVEPIRNRGFRVLVADEADLDEISELRILLEVPGIRRVVERASDEEILALQPTVAAIEGASREHDIAAFLVADRDFHVGLLELAGNGRLTRLVAQLRDQTRLMGLSALTEAGNLDASAREHADVLAAVRERDADRAESLMRRHLEHTRGIWAGRDEAAGLTAGSPAPSTTDRGTDRPRS